MLESTRKRFDCIISEKKYEGPAEGTADNRAEPLSAVPCGSLHIFFFFWLRRCRTNVFLWVSLFDRTSELLWLRHPDHWWEVATSLKHCCWWEIFSRAVGLFCLNQRKLFQPVCEFVSGMQIIYFWTNFACSGGRENSISGKIVSQFFKKLESRDAIWR